MKIKHETKSKAGYILLAASLFSIGLFYPIIGFGLTGILFGTILINLAHIEKEREECEELFICELLYNSYGSLYNPNAQVRTRTDYMATTLAVYAKDKSVAEIISNTWLKTNKPEMKMIQINAHIAIDRALIKDEK